MLNFCTLFNVGYMAKGLALYYSLLKTCPKFHLYIFAFDDITYKILTEKNLTNATIISLNDFENEQLLNVKTDRSIAEYCWTCTPLTIKYCIESFNLDHCTYIDADIFFYTDPKVLLDQMGNNSILITPHNYHSQYDASAVSGIYCVQFVTFKNTADGLIVLNWWAQACLKWCHSRYEDGKMGDQKYLDSWPYMFAGVYICRNTGAGLAPWNLLNYVYKQNNKQISVNGTALVFYHFHDLKYLSNTSWYLGGYEIPNFIFANIYQPYIKALLEINAVIQKQYPGTDPLYTIDIKSILDLNLKFKVGSYIMDFKKSFQKLITDAFFINRKKHYKNYIRLK